MKKFLKCMFGIVITFVLLIVVIWVSLVYVTRYKKATCDKAISPDGQYELILQSVGEAEWPFGSARGNLILKKGKEQICRTGFILSDDGGSVRSDCWKVTWKEDSVNVIISGKEQFDEQFILYYSGEKESKQLTDKK